MKVYLAGSSAPSERPRVEKWIAKLTEAGITVTSTWLDSVKREGSGNPRDATADQRRHWAMTCLDEVRRSTLVWFLVPPPEASTRGAWFEIGFLTGEVGPDAFIASGDTKQSIFCALAYDDECETDEAAFERVLNHARDGVHDSEPLSPFVFDGD